MVTRYVLSVFVGTVIRIALGNLVEDRLFESGWLLDEIDRPIDNMLGISAGNLCQWTDATPYCIDVRGIDWNVQVIVELNGRTKSKTI